MRTLVFFAVMACFAPSFVDAREWSDITGAYKVEAKLITVADGAVELLTSAGDTIHVPLEKLSKRDRARAESWLATRDGAPPKLPANSSILADFRIKKPDGRPVIIPNIPVAAIRWPKERRPIVLANTWTFGDPELAIELDNLEKSVTALQVKSSETGKPIGQGVGVLQLEGSANGSMDDTSKDMTAFWLDAKATANALELAEESPAVGESVWLFVVPKGGTAEPEKLVLLRLEVLSQDEKAITFTTEDGEVPPNIPGAPIVNYAGDVVGLFVLRGGKKGTIVAVRCEDVRSNLASVIKE